MCSRSGVWIAGGGCSRDVLEGWFVFVVSWVGLSSSVGGGVDGVGLVVDHGDVPVSLVQFGVVAGTQEGQI